MCIVFVVKDILVGTGNVTELFILLLPVRTILWLLPLLPGVIHDLATRPVLDHEPLDHRVDDLLVLLLFLGLARLQ